VPVSKNGLFKTKHAYVLTAQSFSELIDLPTLHQRLGHLSPRGIRALMNANSVTGLQLINNLTPFSCDACDYTKMTWKAIKKKHQTPIATHFGAEVHSDVWGPSIVNSLGNRHYYISFTDDCTRYLLVSFLYTKDETFKAYKSYVAWALTQHGMQIQRLRSDRGGEYLSTKFTNYLLAQGTKHCLTMANTLEHNSVAESLN